MSQQVFSFDVSHGVLPQPIKYAKPDGFVGWMDMTDLDTILDFYRFGMFPWENYQEQGAFFFPRQRYLIEPSKIKIPKSIRPYFNQNKFELSFDQAFKEVISSCKMIKRPTSNGTWISDQFIEVYTALHQLGYAHSVEVWKDDYLIGGLYGVSLGKIFTGESMFSFETNASRFALIGLAKYLTRLDFHYIDCQIRNQYLETFGGQDVEGSQFFEILRKNYFESSLVGNWGSVFSHLDKE